MTSLLTDIAWWLFLTQLNAAGWFIISCHIAVFWMMFDFARGLFR